MAGSEEPNEPVDMDTSSDVTIWNPLGDKQISGTDQLIKTIAQFQRDLSRLITKPEFATRDCRIQARTKNLLAEVVALINDMRTSGEVVDVEVTFKPQSEAMTSTQTEAAVNTIADVIAVAEEASHTQADDTVKISADVIVGAEVDSHTQADAAVNTSADVIVVAEEASHTQAEDTVKISADVIVVAEEASHTQAEAAINPSADVILNAEVGSHTQAEAAVNPSADVIVVAEEASHTQAEAAVNTSADVIVGAQIAVNTDVVAALNMDETHDDTTQLCDNEDAETNELSQVRALLFTRSPDRVFSNTSTDDEDAAPINERTIDREDPSLATNPPPLLTPARARPNLRSTARQYTIKEDMQIINYIYEVSLSYGEDLNGFPVNGVGLFKSMQQDLNLDRSAQSLHSRFLRTICTKFRTYRFKVSDDIYSYMEEKVVPRTSYYRGTLR